MSFIFFLVSLGSMLHVDFKKWPCRLVEFRGQEPHNGYQFLSLDLVDNVLSMFQQSLRLLNGIASLIQNRIIMGDFKQIIRLISRNHSMRLLEWKYQSS